MAITLKTAIDPTQLVAQLRNAVISIDPDQPIADVRTMEQWMARSLDWFQNPIAGDRERGAPLGAQGRPT